MDVLRFLKHGCFLFCEHILEIEQVFYKLHTCFIPISCEI